MRKTALQCVYEMAKEDKRIFFIGSDLGFGTLKEFKNEMPDRFFMEGISEGNLVGMAAGLAMEGKIVYINTIATFLSRRCYEQIVLDCGLHNTNVRLIANGGGLVYAPLGPTHLATDDIGILRTVPNMTIVAPTDADEMRRFMPQTVDHKGPIYIRLAKGHDPIVSRDDVPFKIGQAMVMQEGEDALLITTGISLRVALKAAEDLQAQGTQVTILHVPTIKPLDEEAIKRYAKDISTIVVIEEHAIIGGLGSAVAELLMEANFDQPKKFKRIGIPDMFADQYGSQESLMGRFNITSEEIVKTVNEFKTSTTKVTV